MHYVTLVHVAPYTPQSILDVHYSPVAATEASYVPASVTLNLTLVVHVEPQVLFVGDIKVKTLRAMIKQINEENKGVHTREYCSPFSVEIRTALCPDGYQVNNKLMHNKTSDPNTHIDNFVDEMKAYQVFLLARCHYFLITLTDMANKWYKELPPESIYART